MSDSEDGKNGPNSGDDAPKDNIWGKPKSENPPKNNPQGNNPWGNVSSGNFGGKPNNNGQNNPWGSGPSSQQSQNLDDLARRIEDKLKNIMGGNGGPPSSSGPQGQGFNRRTIGAIASVIGFIWLASGVYVVDSGEEALITRFGKYVRHADQGLNYHLPVPFESASIVNVQRINTLTVGASAAQGAEDAGQGLMLTGDENIVNVSFQVFWKVKDAPRFQFNIAHGPNNNNDATITVSAVAEASMREVVGRSPLEKILTNGRAQVELQTRELMQKTLDSYHAGISVTQVNLRRAEPPASVVASFREVAAASQEAETRINQAMSYRNSVVPQAQGEAARFNQLYQEYHLAPEVTRQRLYLETMEKIYERANKVIIENKGSGQMMVLPPEILRNATAPAATANSTPTTPAAAGGN